MVNRQVSHTRPGRVGGRVRSQSPGGDGTKGRPGRPRRDERAGALLALFEGKASAAEIAARLSVRTRTVERWREDAVPLVARALLANGEVSGVHPSPASVPPPKGGVVRRTIRTEKTAAVRSFLLEEFVRVHPPHAEQVAMLSRETPYGRATVAMVCAAFGVKRTGYYGARARGSALGSREHGHDGR